MITCTQCGTNNESRFKFCKKCGHKLEKPQTAEPNGGVGKEDNSGKTKKCPNCKKLNYPKAVFCQYCGKEFKQEEPESAIKKESPVAIPSDAPLLEFQRFGVLQQKRLDQAKTKFQESQVRYEYPRETLWNDGQIAALYEAYCHNHSALVLFLKEAESLSADLEEKRKTCHQQLLLSPDSNLELKDERLKLFSSIAEKDTNSFFQTVKAIVEAFGKNNPVFATGCQLSTPLDLWKQQSSPMLLQQHLFVGTSFRRFHILNQPIDLPRLEFIRLINEKNLIVKYNESSKEQCMSFVSTLLGRMIWSSGGLGLKVDVIDTKDWNGISYQFNNSKLCGLITETNEVGPLLSRLYKDEMEVITTTLKKAHVASVAEYNASNFNKLCTQVLVIKDLNHCTSNADVSLLPKLMEKAAQAGLCVILLVNEDTPKEESRQYRTTSKDPMSSIDRYASTINLVDNTLYGKDSYDDLLFDLMDEKHLVEAIAQGSVANDELLGASSLDYMPKRSQDFWKLKATDEISLAIGMESYSPNMLRLTDNPVESLVMVTGSISSAINLWLDTLVLQVLTKYDPSTVQLLLVDCYGEDSTLFDKFIPISSMEGAPISIAKVEGFDQEVWTRLYAHKEGSPRLMAVIVGSFENQLKEYVDKSRPLYSNGKFRGVDIICVDGRRDAWEPNKIEGWHGLQIAFGPSTIYADLTRRDQFALGADEFYYRGVKNVALLTDEVSVGIIVDTLAGKLRERFPQPIKPIKDAFVSPQTNDGTFGQEVSLVFTETVEKATMEKPEQQGPNISTFVEPLTLVEGREKVGKTDLQLPEEIEEVSYKTTFPLPIPEKLWTGNAEKALTIPIGVHINNNGKLKVEQITFEQEGNNNVAFVVGLPGSGKTSLINALILNAALRYSPDELNMYLVDFSGVEFSHYEKYGLPHAKLIATGADREFGLSVLNEVQQEMDKRSNPEYTNYPRILLVLDECQRFFLNEQSTNSITVQAASIIENILRQGRKHRINIIIATQALSNIPDVIYDLVDIRLVGNPDEKTFRKFVKRGDSDYIITKEYKKGEFLITKNGVYDRKDKDIEDYHIKSYFVKSGKFDQKHELDEKVEMLHEYALQHPELCKTVPETRSFRGTEIVAFDQSRMLEGHKDCKAQPTSMYFYLGESVEGKKDIAIQIHAGQEFQHILIAGGTSPIDGESVVVNGMMSVSQSYELVDVEMTRLEEEPEEVDIDGLEVGLEETEIDQVEDELEETEEMLDDLIDDIPFEPQAVNYVFNFDNNDLNAAAHINQLLISPFSSKSKAIENTEEAVLETLTEVQSLINEREKGQKRYPHVYLTFLQFGNGSMFRDTRSLGNSKCTQLMHDILKRGSQCGVFVILQTQVLKDFALLRKRENIDFSHVVALQMSDNACTFIDLPEASKLNKEGANTSGKCRGIYKDVNIGIVKKFKPYQYINE